MAELEELIATLAALPADERALPGIKSARGDIVLGAALVLEAALEKGGFEAMEVTCSGLREGIFFSRRLLSGGEPLLPDVRASSIRNLTLQSGADIRHADHVARLALQLHDSLVAEGVVVSAPGERGLLWAASLLHDIGMSVGYDGHAAHSQYLIRNAGLAGFAPGDIERIAHIVRYHRKGTPELDDDDDGVVARCALLLRLAEQLERGHDQSVREARFVTDGARAAADAARRGAARPLEPRAPDPRVGVPARVRPRARRHPLAAGFTTTQHGGASAALGWVRADQRVTSVCLHRVPGLGPRARRGPRDAAELSAWPPRRGRAGRACAPSPNGRGASRASRPSRRAWSRAWSSPGGCCAPTSSPTTRWCTSTGCGSSATRSCSPTR